MAAAPRSGPPGEEQHSVGAQQQARRGRQQNRRQQQQVSSRAPSRTSPAQARLKVIVVSFLTRAARAAAPQRDYDWTRLGSAAHERMAPRRDENSRFGGAGTSSAGSSGSMHPVRTEANGFRRRA